MSDGNISKITLPNGNTYDIKDSNVGLSSSYDDSTSTVTLIVGSLESVDNTEF